MGLNDANEARNKKTCLIGGEDENTARHEHQESADDQCSFAPEVVGGGGKPERDGRVASEGEGEEQADLSLRKTDLREIECKDNREEAVAKKPNYPRGEECDDIAVHEN